MKITKGSTVRAATQITEEGFKRADRKHVHARAGERGEVVDIEAATRGRPALLTVRWERTGTASTCFVEELAA